MKKLASLLVLSLGLLTAAPAQAAWTLSGGAWSETQILTRALPDITIKTDWVMLTGVRGFTVEICAESAQTLSGAGTLNAYKKGSVAPNRNPSLDLPIQVASTSCQGAACRCQTWPDLETKVGVGAFSFATSGVTVSGGTTVTIKITPVQTP